MGELAVGRILGHIRSHGGRVTSTTRRIVHIVVENPYSHFRGSDFVVHANAIENGEDDGEEVSESTVYRILDRLVELNILERSQLGSGPQRFHLRPFHHAHLVCEHCGGITDASAELLDDLARRLRVEYGFVLQVGLSSLNGICGSCRQLGGEWNEDDIGHDGRVTGRTD